MLSIVKLLAGFLTVYDGTDNLMDLSMKGTVAGKPSTCSS